MDEEITLLYRRLRRSGMAFLLVLLTGTTGYRILVEGTSWFDGLYMTFLTVTTIGFTEVVNLEGNTMGRVFTIFIALLGIGILTYAFSNLAALVIERDITKQLRRKRMEKIIQRMKNHYLICGASKVGIHIAEELEKTQRPFVIGDLDEDLVRDLEADYKYGKVLVGDCTKEEFLKQMGIEDASGVFVTTRDDHHNIVICITVKQLRPDVEVVSHSKEPENEKKLYAVGSKKVISPSFIGGLRMASEMVRPTVTTFLDTMLRDTDRNLRIEEVALPKPFWNKSIRDLPLTGMDQTLLLAVKEEDSWEYNPAPDYKVNSKSYLIVMTTPEELRSLNRLLQN